MQLCPVAMPIAVVCRPSISSELKQLLGDYAGVTAAVEEAGKLALGGCDILSPVRPKKQQQHTLGAEQQVGVASTGCCRPSGDSLPPNTAL